mgnify:CR=1 FL=1
MKIEDRKTYVKHRDTYRIINSLLMVIRLISVTFITIFIIMAIVYSVVGESFKENYFNITDVLRWVIFVSIIIWIGMKIITVYYRNNLRRAKNKIHDVVDEV